MSFSRYLKDLFWTILCFLAIILIVNLILISSTALNKTIEDIIYMNVLIFSIFFAFLIVGYIKWINAYKDFRNALHNKENIDGFLPNGEKLEEVLIRETVNLKNEEKLKEIKELKDNLNEINDYVTKWIHEIKIPLSVCELIADEIEEEGLSDIAGELRQELERINFLVSQVLYTSRASSYSEDFIIEEVNLNSIVKSVIKNNVNSFISKKIELEMHDLDFNVFTDSKWIFYIIEQIINNACKYVDVQGRIEIYAKENDECTRLFIRDNGMGIPYKDIGRIFDRGFTGDNGRKTSKSTGMGLYICKKIADKLNIKLEVSSQVSQYTEFTIIFYKMADYFNVTKM
ncbi:sensor histidine kinase [Thermoanaerobacterium sp. RBIITD]|uniref:sensor histidine kinase n=1 Tax=Thermoanaerobacterium sp. RBIITD TaxID=1550240 RepID=UPI000BB8BC5A|nr:sensor histidine kinase [Thermoanaerobacterium sp. RBIITD]SNX53707.1 Signal transduction histidine kinase [Thermoanaerobacterium sp. RBIITD]